MCLPTSVLFMCYSDAVRNWCCASLSIWPTSLYQESEPCQGCHSERSEESAGLPPCLGQP